jgi:hypothetical protein
MKQLLLILGILIGGSVYSQTYIYVDASNLSTRLTGTETYTGGKWRNTTAFITVDRNTVEYFSEDYKRTYDIVDIEVGDGNFVLYHLFDSVDNKKVDFNYSESLAIFWWTESGLDLRHAFSINRISK